MGWLSSVASAVTRAPKNILGGVNDAVGGVAHGNFGQALGGAFNAGTFGLFGQQQGPQSPGINQNVSRLKKAQVGYANQFREQLPQIQQQMQGQMIHDTNQNLQGDLRNIKSSNSSRGLLYGGVNAGQEAGQRQQAQKGLMSGISSLNTGLQNEANSLDQAAVKTGIGIQQQQQSMQNAIYQNAMAAQAGQNQIFGSLASAGLMAAMI